MYDDDNEVVHTRRERSIVACFLQCCRMYVQDGQVGDIESTVLNPEMMEKNYSVCFL